MRQSKKRKITIFIAGGMAVVLICLGVMMNVEQLQAKDTLPGISNIVASATEGNPYTILEIVPDVATTTGFADGVLVSGNSITQSMGRLGYYIGGQEPIQLTKDLLLFSTAAERKNYVNQLYKNESGTITGALKDITDEATDSSSSTKPLTFHEYAEVYAFERSLAELEAGVADGTLKLLNYNPLPPEGVAVGSAGTALTTEHIETVTGYVREAKTGDAAFSGNLIKKYVRAENETEDSALKFFNGSDTGFEDASSSSYGDFDPGFKDGSDYVVKFSKIGGRVGYVPISSETVPVGDTWTDAIATKWEGKPVYQCDENGVYVYVGTVQKNETINPECVGVKKDGDEDMPWLASIGPEINVAVLSLDATETSETTVSVNETPETTITETTPTTTTSGNTTGGTTETTGTTTSGNTASQNATPLQQRRGLLQSNSSSYVTLQFEYKELAEVGVQVYQVSSYEKDNGSLKGMQYALDTDKPLVPNVALTGLVKTKTRFEETQPERFVYQMARSAAENSDVDVNYGSYLLAADSNATVEYRLGTNVGLYYTGGFTNNEWFKKYVFDREEAECANCHIQVVTKPVQEVTDADIEQADFIYLSNPSEQFLAYPKSTTTLPLATDYQLYGQTEESILHDITALRAFYILRRALTFQVPLVSDYADNNDVKSSVMYALVRALHMKDDGLQDLYNTNKNSMETVTSNSEPTLRTALNQITDTDLSTYKHYVSENCYSYNLTNADLISESGTTYPFVNDQFKTAFSADVIAERFAEVLKDIENENLYRETDGGRAPLDKTISEATVLRYIINFNYKRTQVKKDKLYVLELQPCASWDLSYVNKAGSAKENGILYYKEDVPAQKRELINQKGTEIILTHMTTAEFIGKNEDINATYDMIYIGLNTGLMNTTSGKTDYNDDTMDGMVYTNVGDYIHAEPSLGGMLNIDYINEDRGKELKGRTYYKASNRIGRYRYSGNDITEEKQRALQDFISAGYPIIVESDMILVDQTTEKRQPNEAVLDNSSNMYALIKNMTGNNSPNHQADKKNLIRLDDMTGDLFNWYLNLSKPVISMTEGTKAAESMLNTRTLSRAADGYYYLQYQFTLSNVGAADINTACDCKLYIDVNADGKFSKTKEQEKDIIITDETGNLQHPDEHGDYSLATGKEYYVKRALSKEYVGVLPWKIEVTQRGNSSRRAGVMGYFEINHDKKEVINILQIKTSTLTGNVNNIDLGAAMENEKSMFYHYIETLNDFEVKVTSMTSAEYKVKHDEYYPSGSYMANAGSEYLNQYDMLILGFSDVYQEADNSTGAMTAIRDYIAAGHSILFTHDTSSISNVPNNQFYANEEGGARRYLSYGDLWDTTYTKVANFGYSFNTLIRGLVGMDRYGILGPNQDILRRGDIVSNTSAEEWNKLTDKSKNGRKDIAYVPGSNRTKTTSEVQGYTYLWLNWLREDKTGTFANYKDIDGNMGQYNNQTITQVNSGQITTYPYKIAKTFKVAPTHAQYYQLDLESDEDQDGESDIVVWYTINDDNTENETLNNEKDIYKFSPGDVRNNYYIFNKGNITYSGVGHSSEEKKYFEGDYSDDVDANEVKLFINTMIAAYRAGLHAPKVTILDNKEYYSREIKNLYIGYDKQYAANQIEDGEIRRDGLLDVAENVFFTADQVNLVEGDQVLAVRYYYESDDADAISLTMSRNEEPVKVKELTAACPLYRASDETAAAEYVIDGHKVYILEASKVYRLAVPTTILPSGKNAVKIYVEVTAIRENKKTGKYEMVPGYGEVSLVRTQMFNLE